MRLNASLMFAALLLISSNTYATIKCDEPKLSKPTHNDSLYHFKAVVTCNLVGEKINLSALKDEYKSDIINNKSQFVVHKQSDYTDKNGMQGYLLNVTQSYDTDHGALKVHADVTLTDDKSKKFAMELRSKNIDGEGEAGYNKFILNQTNLQLLPDHAELIIIKEIDVEEPWYVTDSFFFDAVEPELIASIRKAALQHAQKISGQDVDPMRK